MKCFHLTHETEHVVKEREHGGTGQILFRRCLFNEDFSAPIDFIDYTIIPTNSSIGKHKHLDNEEIYFIIKGNPLIIVDTEERRLPPGGISIVHSGQSHELINDTTSDVCIFVVQIRVQ